MPVKLLVLLAGMLAAAPAWIEVPFVAQTDRGCGPASLAMVVQYWVAQNPRVDPAAGDYDKIEREIAGKSARGVAGEELKKYLQRHGFNAFVISGEISDLRHHLDRGRPAVVCLGPRGPKAPLHYAVVVGLEADAVLLNDPARGKLFREDLASFTRAWKLTENWMLLAVPRQSA